MVDEGTVVIIHSLIGRHGQGSSTDAAEVEAERTLAASYPIGPLDARIDHG